jgi:hypothetical protein
VAELLGKTVEHGRATRLDWPEDDLDEHHWVRPYVQDQVETAVLPKVEDCSDNNL